ncbi:MAG: M12 family metallo-peptidase [Phycisphaerales bacterium]|nr:M12 family metallo-peptidase [Phycisphaerales bacterium]MCI0631774.1 M12 family metallo-peptidase [Phycisphaerales bacterium]MCI0676340.1 M12 family metallo-peptidase [Phycisphaerales bacterium]
MNSNGTLAAALAASLGLLAASTPVTAEHTISHVSFPDLFQPLDGDSDHGFRLQIDQKRLAELLASDRPVEIQFPVSVNRSLALQLRPFDIVTPETKFLQATRTNQTRLAPPSITLFRGEIAGDPGSHVYLSFMKTGAANGFIRSGSGVSLELLTVREPGQPMAVLVRPAATFLPGFDQLCMTILPPADGGIAGGSPPDPARGVRVLTVAIDGDQSFTNLFESTDEANAYIVQLIGAVSDIYIRDCNFKLVLGFARLWPDGGEPFSADDLGGFRNYWIFNEDLTGLNLVHMLSGRRDLPYGGVAYLTNGCSDFAFGIDGFLLGGFPAPVEAPNLNNWDVVVVAHEIGHNLGTPHTHDLEPPIDTCAQGTDERGTIMSYCHTRMGGLLNIDMRFHAGTIDIIVESNPTGGCLWHDCNGNGQSDLDDISAARSFDVNANSIPDECEDCNANGILDPDEIAGGLADLNVNGIPDSCEPDCNTNKQPDAWEIALNLADDANGDLIPDSCQPDCNNNGTFDFVDIADGVEVDLDRNSAPDSCQDCNSNGLPDWLDVGRQFNLFVGQTSSSVREYHAASGVLIDDVGFGQVDGAYDVTFGSDRQLYVASFNDNRIVRIDVDSGSASDLVAPGSGGLVNPVALTFGPNGNLFVISQALDSNVIQYDGQTGATIGTFVSGHLGMAWDLTFGPDGHLYVATANNRIRKYNGVTGAFLANFISGPLSLLNDPRGLLFLPNGDLLVTNRGGNNVTRYNALGTLMGVFNDEYPLQLPWGIARGPNGNIYIASTTLEAVRLIEYDLAAGRYLRSFVRGDSSLTAPTSFAFRPSSPNDSNGNNIPDACDIYSCPGDLAPAFPGDGTVNSDDLLAVIGAWGSCDGCPADLNQDGQINVIDLLLIIETWGPCPTD